MLEYNIIYCSILIGVFLCFFDKKKTYNVYYIIVCTFMLAVCGLRNEYIGIDTSNYLYYFTNPTDTNGYYQSKEDFEPGLNWLNHFISLFISNKYIYQLLLTALFQIPIYIFFKRYSENKFISLFLYTAFSIGCSIYFMGFNAMRQSLAIGLFMWCLLAYMDNGCNLKNIKVISLLVAMILVHKSSILVVLPFILSQFRLSKKTYILIVCMSMAIGFVMKYFFSYLELAFILITGGTFYTQSLTDGGFNFISLLPYSLICLCIILYSRKEELNNLFFNSLIMAIFLQGIMAFSGNNIDRMCAYYYVLGIVSISNFIMSKNKSFLVRSGMTICVLIYFTYKYYASLQLMTEGGHNFIPFNWCF